MKCCTKCLRIFAKKHPIKVKPEEEEPIRVPKKPGKEESCSERELGISHKDVPVPCIEITVGKRKIQVNSIFSHNELKVLKEGDNRLNSFVASSIDHVSNSSRMVEEAALENLREEMNNHYVNELTEGIA